MIRGDCFNLAMKDGTILYIMNLGQARNAKKPAAVNSAIEAWMYQPGSGCIFICSSKEHESVSQALVSLYNGLCLWAHHPRVKPELKSVIDAFMNDDFST